MDFLVDKEHGAATLLASIVVLLALHLFFKLGEFVLEFYKKKNEVSEKSIENLTKALSVNTIAVERLEIRLNEIEKDLNEFPKFKVDLRRVFSAVKMMAGPDWPEIKKSIMDEM